MPKNRIPIDIPKNDLSVYSNQKRNTVSSNILIMHTGQTLTSTAGGMTLNTDITYIYIYIYIIYFIYIYILFLFIVQITLQNGTLPSDKIKRLFSTVN